MKITDIDFKEKFRALEESAWYKNGSKSMYIISGKDVLEIEGYIYEPRYESFSTTHLLRLNNEVLYGKDSRSVAEYRNEIYTFGKFKDEKMAVDYVKEYFANKEISISYTAPDKEQINNNDLEDEDEEEM